MIRVALGLALIFISLHEPALSDDSDSFSAEELQLARAAMVTLTFEERGQDNRWLSRSEPWLNSGPGFRAPWRQLRAVSGFRINRDNQVLIVSVLSRELRESNSLRTLTEGSVSHPVRVLAWDPACDLVVLQQGNVQRADPQRVNAEQSDAQQSDAQKVSPQSSGSRPRSEPGADGSAALTLSDTAILWGSPIRILSQWEAGVPMLSAGLVSTQPSFDAALGAERFQIDAILHPGSQGGPVFDQTGRVIGIVAGVRNRDEGIGSSAISTEPLTRLIDFVRDGGQGAIPKPWFGITMVATESGVVVRDIVVGSAAQQAGIQAGDRIVAVDSQPVQRPRDVSRAVVARRPGQTLSVTVQRGEQQHELTATLAESPTSNNDAARAALPSNSPTDLDVSLPQPISPDELKQRLERELFDTAPDGALLPPRIPAASAGEAELRNKLDAITEQLRKLSEQVERIQTRSQRDPENAAEKRATER